MSAMFHISTNTLTDSLCRVFIVLCSLRVHTHLHGLHVVITDVRILKV
jgi:hypothetical protein